MSTVNTGQVALQGATLEGLSGEAQRLITLVAKDANFADKLFGTFIERPETAWTLAEATVGPLTSRDRLVLEMFAQLFIPASQQVLVIYNKGDCNGSNCWV